MSNKPRIKSKKKSGPVITSPKETKYDYAVYQCEESQKVQLPYGELVIPARQPLIMPNSLPVKKTRVAIFENIFKEYEAGINLNKSSLLITRYGGIGDILAVIPALVELKKKFDVKIGFMCSPTYFHSLTCFPNVVDQIVDVINNFQDLRAYKYILGLDNEFEKDPMSNHIPIQELFARKLGVTLTPDTIDEVIHQNVGAKKHVRSGIGIQYNVEAIIRNYNIEKVIELIEQIVEKYPSKPIFLLGNPDDFGRINYIESKLSDKAVNAIIPNGCGNKKLNLMDTIGLVSSLELVIGPDSSMLHVAGVTGTPMIGLFGPFPSNLRIGIYKNAIGIDGKTACSPCFRHHPINFCPYNSSEGICLNTIPVNTIMDNVNNILG